MNTKIYSIFPACGKTWLYKHQEDYGLKILDSDSSKFSWVEVDDGNNGWRKERNPDFPNNYIKHIKENMGKYDCIFVSSHKAVREALDKAGIEFTLVYPNYSDRCRAEWVGRCFIREKEGESGCSAEVLYNNWDQWIIDCMDDGFGREELILDSDEYLNQFFV